MLSMATIVVAVAPSLVLPVGPAPSARMLPVAASRGVPPPAAAAAVAAAAVPRASDTSAVVVFNIVTASGVGSVVDFRWVLFFRCVRLFILSCSRARTAVTLKLSRAPHPISGAQSWSSLIPRQASHIHAHTRRVNQLLFVILDWGMYNRFTQGSRLSSATILFPWHPDTAR